MRQTDIDLQELRADAYHRPAVSTALALVSIASYVREVAADVRTIRDVLKGGTTLSPAAVASRARDHAAPRRVLDPCVECQSEVYPVGPDGDVVRCGTCGFTILATEAARIRARVEGTGS